MYLKTTKLVKLHLYHLAIFRSTLKSIPQRSLSLSPGWKIGEDLENNPSKSDEVELFLEKYVLPLQEINNSISDLSNQEYDSGMKIIIFQIFIQTLSISD